MGAQPLYGVRATVRDAAGAVCDQREFRLACARSNRPDAAGGRQPVLRARQRAGSVCRGVNIGPHDAILARISDAKYEALVAEPATHTST